MHASVPAICLRFVHQLVGTLHQFRGGQRVTIREVQDDNPDRLRHWQSLGLIPGATVTFMSHQPLDDIFHLQLGGKAIHVGSEGLAGLLGELAADGET